MRLSAQMQRHHLAILLSLSSALLAFALRGAYNIGWIELTVLHDASVWGMIGTVIVAVVVFSLFHDWQVGKRRVKANEGAIGMVDGLRSAMLAVALPWALFMNYMVLIGMPTRCAAVSTDTCSIENQLSFLVVATAIGSVACFAYLMWIRIRR